MPQATLQPWRLSVGRPGVWRALLCSLLLYLRLQRTTGSPCLEGQDVSAKVRENSLMGQLVAELITKPTRGNRVIGRSDDWLLSEGSTPTDDAVHWIVTGKDADWFFLDRTSLRLNASSERVLDREVQGSVLMAALTCYEEDTVQREYRIVVEILNENDNRPVFLESITQPLNISELTAVNTVVFTVKATDADDDTIMYSIDETSPDAEYFKVLLPNRGDVILAKPLDYETKTQLMVTIHAAEMNTAERFNTSTTVTMNIQDGDDQYPQFLPCTLLFQDQSNRICTNPVYTVNVTEGEQDILLDFSPGPIHAVDGDRDLSSPLSYTILSGGDNGRFVMDEVTGEVRLTRGVEDRLLTPTQSLLIMAAQRDDPRKYSVATVLIRVLTVNRFPPKFDRAEYCGFVTEGNSPATLVNTYGNTVLLLRVLDLDFTDGINPKIHYSFRPTSNHTQFYQVTQEGLLIARTNELRPSQKHSVEVVAVDQESGDTIQVTVMVQVLYEGQEVPHGPLGEGRPCGCSVGRAVGVCGLVVTVLCSVLYVVLCLVRRHRSRMTQVQGCVAQGKHPNVSLRWFELVSHRSPTTVPDDLTFHNEALTYSSSSSLQGKHGISSQKDAPHPLSAPPNTTTPPPPTTSLNTRGSPTDSAHSPTTPNGMSDSEPCYNTVSPPTRPPVIWPVTSPLPADTPPQVDSPLHTTPTDTPTYPRAPPILLNSPFPSSEQVDPPDVSEERGEEGEDGGEVEREEERKGNHSDVNGDAVTVEGALCLNGESDA